MKKVRILKSVLFITFNAIVSIGLLLTLTRCDTDEPPMENPEEQITKVTVNFTPTGGGTAITVSAIDPDGDGPQDIAPEGDVNLEYNLEYSLTIEFENHLANPVEDITEEVRDEGDEHMIFFGWTGDIFQNPGNSDINTNREDVQYDDTDENGFPIGLETTWTTSLDASSGNFRIVLKHQPDLKSATSGVSTGATDADVKFDIVVSK